MLVLVGKMDEHLNLIVGPRCSVMGPWGYQQSSGEKSFASRTPVHRSDSFPASGSRPTLTTPSSGLLQLLSLPSPTPNLIC